MKFTQLVGLLALGLGASTVTAANCKPSFTPASSSSIEPASSSAIPSPQPSPSTPAGCDPNANPIKNGDFSDGLTSWTTSGGAAYESTDCGTFPTCVSMQSQEQTDYLEQVIDTIVGVTYPVSLYYAAIDYMSYVSSIHIEIGDETNVNERWTIAPYTTFTELTNTFIARSTKTKIALVVRGDYNARVDFTNVVVQNVCPEPVGK